MSRITLDLDRCLYDRHIRHIFSSYNSFSYIFRTFYNDSIECVQKKNHLDLQNTIQLI